MKFKHGDRYPEIREHYSYSYGMTKEQLIEYAYTIVQDKPKEEPTEMTLEEIEKLVGKKVKLVGEK